MKYFLFIFLYFFAVTGVIGQNAQNQIQTQSNLAFQYYNARDFERAAPLLQQVYELTKNSTYFKYYLDCLIQMEKYDEAVQKIQSEIKKQQPEKPELFVNWGYILKVQKKVEESKQKYERALDLVLPNRNEYTLLSNAFLQWQEYEYAKQTYLKGEQIMGPGIFDYELARVYSYLRDYDNMMEKYLDMVKFDEKQLPRVQSGLSSSMRLDIDDEMLDIFREQVLKRIQANPEVIGYNLSLIHI